MGFDVGEPFSSASEALAWLATHTPTIAILDYSLKDGPCTMLMRTLQERGIPFVVYSGPGTDAAPHLSFGMYPGSPSHATERCFWRLSPAPPQRLPHGTRIQQSNQRTADADGC